MRLRPGLGLGVKNQHLGRDDESEAIEFPDPTDELGRHARFVTGSPHETPPGLLNRSRLGNEPLSPKRNATSSPRPRGLHGTKAAPLAHAMSRSSSISPLWVERSRTKTACYESRPQHWRYEGELDLSEHFRTEPVDSCAGQDGSTPGAHSPATSASPSQPGGRSSAAIPALNDERKLPRTRAMRV